ncbi:MAG: bifunctional pyr operon transcriptional regulator/uracil phosphoribosyltransferase PyrR [Endomicrobiia bacterium]
MNKVILNDIEIRNIIKTLAKKVVDRYKDLTKTALVGIHTNGVYIANRLKEEIKNISGKELNIGVVDITFYRDDIGLTDIIKFAKDTEINFDINNKNIILVDDVIYTGRTIRAAMEQILEIGRPKTISVLALVDRGLRELPIYAEFVGKIIKSSPRQEVKVLLKEDTFTKKKQILKDKIILCNK